MHVIVVKYIFIFPTSQVNHINNIIFYYNQNSKTPKLHIFGIQIEKMIAHSSLVCIGLHVAAFHIPIPFILSHMLTFKIFICSLTIFIFFSPSQLVSCSQLFFCFFLTQVLKNFISDSQKQKGMKLTKMRCNKVL